MSFFEDLFDSDHRRGGHGYDHDDRNRYNDHHDNRYQERNYAEHFHCKRCSTELIPGGRFCFQCGAPVDAQKPHCASCQKEILEGAKFCPHCGAGQS